MCRRRRIPRIARRGFTLIELMIIVVIIGVVAVIAVGSMSRARNERIIFDYARKIEGILHRGQTRAFGRGSPHFAMLDPGAGNRGRVMLFEGTDGVAPPSGAPAPDTNNTCRSHAWAWTYTGWSPGAADPTYLNEPLEGIDLGDTAVGAINVDENITATFIVSGVPANAVAICYSRNGTAYVGAGANMTAAATALTTATPFTGVVEVNVVRHDAAHNGLGQGRKVIVASGAAPRLRPCNGFTPGCP